VKALVCGECMDIRALNPGPEVPVTCRCGKSAGWWIDPQRGVARFWRSSPGVRTFFLGMHNHFVVRMLQEPASDAVAREMHEMVTDAPGYQFDKAHKGCWAVLQRPGYSSDTAFEDELPTSPDSPDLAWNIVNQLFDLAEVPVEKRQAVNDQADAFVTSLLERRTL
jgi:hypothetical protein